MTAASDPVGANEFAGQAVGVRQAMGVCDEDLPTVAKRNQRRAVAMDPPRVGCATEPHASVEFCCRAWNCVASIAAEPSAEVKAGQSPGRERQISDPR